MTVATLQHTAKLLTFRKPALEAHAIYIGEHIDLRVIPHRIASNPLLARTGKDGWVAGYRYGVLVFFNVDIQDRSEFVARLRPGVTEPYDAPEREATIIRIEAEANFEGVEESGEIVLSCLTVERLQLIASSLAKSVVMAQYELELSDVFQHLQPLARNLTEGHGGHGHLLKHIGHSLLIEQKMVGRVEVSEKPELLWEHPELEPFYQRLSEEYEILQRHAALERKLALIRNTAATALGLLQHRRSLRVEWYIVLLIVIEIGLTLYELFVRHG